MPTEINDHDLKSITKVVSATSMPTGERECNFSATKNIKALQQNSLSVPTIASWLFIKLAGPQPLFSQFDPTQYTIKTVAGMMAFNREDSLS